MEKYKLNLTAKTLTITKAFEEAVAKGDTPEYRLYKKLMRDITDFNLVDFSSEFVYYRVYKKFGVQTHDVVSRKEYAEAWRVYWEYKDEAEEPFASSRAFQAMYTWFGGVPRKQKLIEKNGIYNELIDWLVDILIEDYGVE